MNQETLELIYSIHFNARFLSDTAGAIEDEVYQLEDDEAPLTAEEIESLKHLNNKICSLKTDVDCEWHNLLTLLRKYCKFYKER